VGCTASKSNEKVQNDSDLRRFIRVTSVFKS
jgi:hypothetical protein